MPDIRPVCNGIKQRMNIAMVASSVPQPNRKLGGVEIFIHRLANELTKHDNVTIFTLCDSVPSDAQYHHETLFSALTNIKKRKLFVWFGFPLLLNFVNFRRFDVIHLHGDDWFYFSRDIPSLRTMHGSALNEARSATSMKNKVAQYAIYPLEHLSARLATVTVGVGKDSQDIYKLPHIINNGVELQRFYPGEKSSEPSILFVGTWQGRKRGQFMFEQFVQHILPSVPQARLWMVCDHCPTHSNVDWIVFPDDETLARLFRQAWVYGSPSIYEGFGITYVEALASGTAIVTSRNKGSEHVLEGGKWGIIADDEGFSGRVVELLTNVNLRERLQKEGREHSARFSWNTVADSYRLLYQKIAASRKCKTPHREWFN